LSGNYDKVRQTLKINQLYPFSSERKRMSILLEAQDNVHRLYTKVTTQLAICALLPSGFFFLKKN
jgi:magnesium-transporting ATPase (P-type)